MDRVTQDTVDFCDSPTCMFKRIDNRDDVAEPHLPTHDMIKVRRRVHQRQMGITDRDAKTALKKSRAIFKELQSSANNDPEVDALTSIADGQQVFAAQATLDIVPEEHGVICTACKKNLTQPCWFCVHCSGECKSVMNSKVVG